MSIPIRYWTPTLIIGALIVALLFWSQRDKGTVAADAPQPAMVSETRAPPVSPPPAAPHEVSQAAPEASAPIQAAPAAVSLTPVVEANQNTAPLPVAIDTSDSQDRPGMHRVALHNSSQQPLNVSVTLNSHDSEKNLQEVLTLAAGADAVIGSNDGWQIEAGDTLVLSSPGFADRSLQIQQ